MEEILYNRFFGVITKLTKIDENKYINQCGVVTDLEKHTMMGGTSSNIIDLIEVGDYVNGCRVYAVEERGVTVCQKVEHSDVDYNWITIDEIKTIKFW